MQAVRIRDYFTTEGSTNTPLYASDRLRRQYTVFHQNAVNEPYNKVSNDNYSSEDTHIVHDSNKEAFDDDLI